MLDGSMMAEIWDANFEAYKEGTWDETMMPSLESTNYTMNQLHNSKLLERLNEEIRHLQAELQAFPSDEISRHLDTIRLDDVSTATYTTARSMLLSLELEHTGRCQKLASLQKDVTSFYASFAALVDSIQNEKLIDSVPSLQARLAHKAQELLVIAGRVAPEIVNAPNENPVEVTQSTVKTEQVEETNLMPSKVNSSAASVQTEKTKRRTGRPLKKRPLPLDSQSTACSGGTEERPFYIIERIVGYDDRPGLGVFYKVQWKDYPGQDTWEPESEIIAADAEDLILDYKRRWNACHPKHLHWPLPPCRRKELSRKPSGQVVRREPPAKRRRSRIGNEGDGTHDCGDGGGRKWARSCIPERTYIHKSPPSKRCSPSATYISTLNGTHARGEDIDYRRDTGQEQPWNKLDGPDPRPRSASLPCQNSSGPAHPTFVLDRHTIAATVSEENTHQSNHVPSDSSDTFSQLSVSIVSPADSPLSVDSIISSNKLL